MVAELLLPNIYDLFFWEKSLEIELRVLLQIGILSDWIFDLPFWREPNSAIFSLVSLRPIKVLKGIFRWIFWENKPLPKKAPLVAFQFFISFLLIAAPRRSWSSNWSESGIFDLGNLIKRNGSLMVECPWNFPSQSFTHFGGGEVFLKPSRAISPSPFGAIRSSNQQVFR